MSAIKAPFPAASGTIPPVMLEMQRRAESQFMAMKRQEQKAILAAAQKPIPFHLPARPSRALRGVMRLLPWLGRRWNLRALRQSGLFDPAWYLERNPDVRQSGQDAAMHYLRHGGLEGRDPSPRFSSAHYLQLYPDVKAAGINPLVHYLTSGWRENRSIHAEMPESRL